MGEREPSLRPTTGATRPTGVGAFSSATERAPWSCAGEIWGPTASWRRHSTPTVMASSWVPGVGFKSRPYVSTEQIDADAHLPSMDGAGLYRRAVRLMPHAAHVVLERAGIKLDEVDLVVAHQANDRILEGVRKQLGMLPEKVPSNIAAYGNITAATLPILYHELRSAGRVPPGTVVCFAAFGAGAHYGAALYREPTNPPAGR